MATPSQIAYVTTEGTSNHVDVRGEEEGVIYTIRRVKMQGRLLLNQLINDDHIIA